MSDDVIMPDNVESYRKKVLDKIHDVSKQRQEGYGSALSSFSRIGTMWTAYIQAKFGISIEIGADDVGFLMELFKMCREMNKPDFENGIDGTNYALFGYALSDTLRKNTSEYTNMESTSLRNFVSDPSAANLFSEKEKD